jgi:hypothetical protein
MSRRKGGRTKRRQLQLWEGNRVTRGLSVYDDALDPWYGYDLGGHVPYSLASFKPDWDRWLFRPRTRFPDFDFVTPSLATGGFVKDEVELAVLKAAGITHVVNTSSEVKDEGDLFKDSGIEYLWNPTFDNYLWKDAEWFNKTIAFAVPAILDGGKAYVHCLEGVNRGPSSAYAVLRVLGHDGDEAFDLIKTARERAKVFYREDADRAVKELVA